MNRCRSSDILKMNISATGQNDSNILNCRQEKSIQ
jgi:predicted nucleic-acid-binding Zn-ribbon protein